MFTQGNGHYSWWSTFRECPRTQRGMENRLRAGVGKRCKKHVKTAEDPRRCHGQRSLPGQHHARPVAPSFGQLDAGAARLLYSPIWVNIIPNRLDGVFNALCDPTRRAILARLTDTDARVTDIAADFPISLNSISKHIRMLERAGLVTPLRAGARPRAVTECRAAGRCLTAGSSITAASGKNVSPPSEIYVTSRKRKRK